MRCFLLAVSLVSTDAALMALRRPAFNLPSWRPFWNREPEPDANAALFEDWKGKLAEDEPDRVSRTRKSVSELMTSQVVTLAPDMPLHDASCAFREHKVSGAPVVEDGVVVGMLSQTDMLYKAAGKTAIPLVTSGAASVRYASNTRRMRKALAGDVRCAMTTAPIISIAPQASIQDAAALLIRHKVSRLPVIDSSNELVGIITTLDVMDYVTVDPEVCLVTG